MLYCSWDMAPGRCNYYFLFRAILPIFAHLWNFQKSEKNAWIYHHFTYVHQKLWLDDVRFLRYGARWTDGRTERRKKWHIEVGAPPKNINMSNRVQIFLRWKKERTCKPNSLLQTFVYRSKIYYFKIDQRGNWKSNSSTLHLE